MSKEDMVQVAAVIAKARHLSGQMREHLDALDAILSEAEAMSCCQSSHAQEGSDARSKAAQQG